MTNSEKAKAYREKMKQDITWVLRERERKRLVAKRHRKANPDAKKVENSQYYQKNPWYYTAFCGKFTENMPPWADKARILAIYKEAYEKDLEVDHIYPRNGKHSCGLHVHYNLQLMTTAENATKRNQLPELP